MRHGLTQRDVRAAYVRLRRIQELLAAGRLDAIAALAGARLRSSALDTVKSTASRGFAMKVVLFCGGLGMRIREAGENVPKPMVTIGYRPILWHVMKYYAHFGHKDFVLCLGYRGDVDQELLPELQRVRCRTTSCCRKAARSSS